VIAWEDLVECASRAVVRKRGLERLEGKDYVVREGDVLNIRFNV
jgi:ribosome-binding ATPase YchF (GTP1/OBG family)